jgi:putative redox protein
MKQIKLRWIEGQVMVGSDSNNHSIVIGKTGDPEGTWLGVKPAELLLMAAAACSSWDVIEILTKQREPFTDIAVICTGEQQSDPPWTFTNIHLKYIITGEVNEEKLKRAIRLSEEKYCSVTNTLRMGTEVTSNYEIMPE